MDLYLYGYGYFSIKCLTESENNFFWPSPEKKKIKESYKKQEFKFLQDKCHLCYWQDKIRPKTQPGIP